MPVKVCIISTVHAASDVRIFLKEARSLKKHGYDVIMLIQDEGNEIKDGIRIVPLPSYRSRFNRILFSGIRVLKEALAQKADIYHFHDPELLPVGLLLKLAGKRVVYDVHEDVPRDILLKYWIPCCFRKIISVMFAVFENVAARMMDYVIAATPAICERFTQKGITAAAVNNYPILEEFEHCCTGRQCKADAVCYIGTLSENRCLPEMIRAIDKANAMFFLAGRYYPPDLRNRLRLLPGWEKVIELGVIGRKEVAQVMSSSIAGLILLPPQPNLIVALPVKMFEYMAAGIPVIASDFPLWKEIIEGGGCGRCVNPLDEDEIACAVSEILHDNGLAAQMGANGRKMAEEKYNWSREEAVLLNVYDILRGS